MATSKSEEATPELRFLLPKSIKLITKISQHTIKIKYVLSSSVVSYHQIVEGNQEQWQYYEMFQNDFMGHY